MYHQDVSLSKESSGSESCCVSRYSLTSTDSESVRQMESQCDYQGVYAAPPFVVEPPIHTAEFGT